MGVILAGAMSRTVFGKGGDEKKATIARAHEYKKSFVCRAPAVQAPCTILINLAQSIQ